MDPRFPSRLRRLRVTKGLSQRDLAGPGVSYAYISRLEHGARKPSFKATRFLAAKLGVTAYFLETGKKSGRCPMCNQLI